MRGSNLAAIVAVPVLASGCYMGFGAGPTLVTSRSNTKNGADSMAELGLVFDYKRVVRVGYARSLQLYDGARSSR
jgi:hypothetical protein